MYILTMFFTLLCQRTWKTCPKNGTSELYFAPHQSRILSFAKLSRKQVYKMTTSVNKFSMFQECFAICSFLVKFLYIIFLTTTNANEWKAKCNGTVHQKREKNIKIKSNRTHSVQPLISSRCCEIDFKCLSRFQIYPNYTEQKWKR